MDRDEHFMGEALAEAEIALAQGEFPVGCVLVHRNRVLARGSRTGTAGGGGNEIDHAEIMALRRLSEAEAPFKPEAVTAYCTLEPCLMCFGALLLAGIGRVVYAFEDVMGGAAALDRSHWSPLYRERAIAVRSGLRRAESLALFKKFFSDPEKHYCRGTLLAAYILEQ
ncbi:MAG: nucleoside deaminase [Desulfobacterales bacterium]|nr:nucleoside deaminase [Desulfobacterales bacterium]